MGEEEGKDLKHFTTEQNNVISQINRALPNFKKIGAKNLSASKIQNRQLNLKRLWERCQELDVKINRMAKDEDIKTEDYFVQKFFERVEGVYLEASDHIAEALYDFEGQAEREAPGSSAPGGSALNTTPAGQQTPRLSCIEIPKFSGNRTEWENFRDLFESLIKNNRSLSNVERMHYLKTSLTGEAAIQLNNVKVTEANFEDSWRLISDEYENKLLLINVHLQTIYDLPVMKTESVAALRSLRDTVKASIAALKNLSRPVDQWDDLLIFWMNTKLAFRTRQEWQMKVSESTDLPTLQDFLEFLTKRIRGLEDNRPNHSTSNQSQVSRNAKVHSTDGQHTNNISCPVCSEKHAIYKCKRYLQCDVSKRYLLVKRAKYCTNCLHSGHSVIDCPSKKHCFKCSKSHHTTLHRDGVPKNESENKTASKPSDNGSTASVASIASGNDVDDNSGTSAVHTVQHIKHSRNSVLLPTALVILRTAEGREITTRALIDQCSTYSFVSESLAQTLRTRRYKTNLSINTFGAQYNGSSKSKLQLFIEPVSGKGPSLSFNAYVYQRISSYAASKPRALSKWPHLQGLELADPNPYDNKAIHLLIGSDIYGAILLNDLRKGPLDSPIAQLTIFGWIVSGPVDNDEPKPTAAVASVHTVCADIDKLLTRFWETEEIGTKRHLTAEEQMCEDHFRSSHYRNEQGRYVVRLPFKGYPPPIGGSLAIASRQYSRLERRLERDPGLSETYNAFLREYRDLGHMEIVPPMEQDRSNAVYLPHHPVIRDDSATTKLRIVFNASCATSNGTSLNDHLLIGPKLQNDLPSIVIRWRQHKYVLTSDIAKMFRQILVHPGDCDYQRVLWRPAISERVMPCRLLTVTYGTAPAPYLAIRVLQQLAEDEGDKFPRAKSVLQSDVYVDDVLFGADTLADAREVKGQLCDLLSAGGFHLRKWASNVSDLLEDLPQGDHELAIDLPIQEDASIKLLGISWAPRNDSFFFKATVPEKIGETKRTVLSTIAKLFDPLGWATPMVIAAKILMQEIWLLKCDWDEPLPAEILKKWQNYCRSLPILNNIRIPRWTGHLSTDLSYELHGFSDASNRPFAAVAYLRVERAPDNVTVTLVAAKSKVAPIKTLSIPRLELNGAVLLVKLLESVSIALQSTNIAIYCWTDSTVVLDWLKNHPSKWSTFIANRVAKIQTTLPTASWRHVTTSCNPADCASRGISSEELRNHKLWWYGPPWLSLSPRNWPSSREDYHRINENHDANVNIEVRKSTVHAISDPKDADKLENLPNHLSSWPKLLRVTAYIQRFVANVKVKRAKKAINLSFLSASEIRDARLWWIKRVQTEFFATEIKALQTNEGKERVFPPRSPLIRLHPFLDKGLLRLGGRLKHSQLPYDEKHPFILPKCRLAELIIEHAHQRALHGGPQLTLRILRQNYWILGARQLVRLKIYRCLPCIRQRGETITQLMGDLPPARVTPSKPFSHTGVDYAGPFQVLPTVGRGQRSVKSYIAVFVCLSTRAIHLEVATSYTSTAFLAAFKRFASRRGIPSDLYSDNGTNFQGAEKELATSFRKFANDQDLASRFATDGTTWHFIPSAAPHFGGLWESGVKSVKHHLRRIVKDRTLLLEEFNTLLCQIEACLNSRPLCALTSDPEDFAVLTPGHFLTGASLTTIPEESVIELNENRLSRYQLVRAMYEHFWRAWTKDYLHSLQMRNKWRREKPNLQKGTLVLLKNNLLPPCKWELARVIETFPGADNLTRVVQVKTARSAFKRPISQICPLPIKCEE